MRDLFRLIIPIGLGIVALPVLQSAADVDFAREIQPIFGESCYSFRGHKVQMAGLRPDVRPSREFTDLHDVNRQSRSPPMMPPHR